MTGNANYCSAASISNSLCVPHARNATLSITHILTDTHAFTSAQHDRHYCSCTRETFWCLAMQCKALWQQREGGWQDVMGKCKTRRHVFIKNSTHCLLLKALRTERDWLDWDKKHDKMKITLLLCFLISVLQKLKSVEVTCTCTTTGCDWNEFQLFKTWNICD